MPLAHLAYSLVNTIALPCGGNSKGLETHIVHEAINFIHITPLPCFKHVSPHVYVFLKSKLQTSPCKPTFDTYNSKLYIEMLKRPPAIIGVSLTFLFDLFGDTSRINLLKNLWGMTLLLTTEQKIGEIFASEVKMSRRHGGIKLLGLIDKLRLIHYIFYLTLFSCFITIPNSVRCKVTSNNFIVVEHNGLLQNVNLVSSETQSYTHTISSDGLHNNMEMELESSPLESADDMNLFKQSEQHHRRWHLGKTIYDVLAYGAVGDGTTNDTQVIITCPMFQIYNLLYCKLKPLCLNY
jgi:hypothetical protein